MKLINADTIPYFGETDVGDHITFKSAIDKLEEVDAEPVRHGHWVDVQPEKDGAYGSCSICGYEEMPTFYCPYCGAKMDEAGDLPYRNLKNSLKGIGW